MAQTKDIKGLSDSELDDLISHGIEQQETVPRHSERYQELLGLVAEAKEEKGGRAESGKSKSGETKGDIHQIAADYEGGSVKDMNHGQTSLVESDAPSDKDIKEAGVKKTPRKVTPGAADEIPAENINQGLPGIVPDAAKDTPENNSTQPA